MLSGIIRFVVYEKKKPDTFVVHKCGDWVFMLLCEMCLPQTLLRHLVHYLSDVKRKKKRRKKPPSEQVLFDR